MMRRQFTLIEVVVAMLILTMGVTSMLMLIAASTRRTGKAVDVWRKNHLLAQAVEYFMLYPPGTEIDRNFFPDENYTVSCNIISPDLPEDVEEQIGGQRLIAMHIEIRDRDGKLVDSITMDRITGVLE